MSDTVRVHHDQAGHRFEAMIEGHCAYLAYMDLGKQTLDMYRTFVPDALRGRGIAAALGASHAVARPVTAWRGRGGLRSRLSSFDLPCSGRMVPSSRPRLGWPKSERST